MVTRRAWGGRAFGVAVRRASAVAREITLSKQSAAAPSTPRRMGVWRLVEVVCGACAYDFVTPACAGSEG
jgi:hypothetical protein